MSGRQDDDAPGTDGSTRGLTPGTAVATPPGGTVAPLLPTQAGHAVSGPVPVVPVPLRPVEPPASTAPPVGPLPSGDPVPADRPRRRQAALAALTVGAVLVAAGGVWQVQELRTARAEAQRATAARVAAAAAAVAPERGAPRLDVLVAGTAAVTAQRADATAAGKAAVERANATLAAAPQAGDGPRGQLQAAIGSATGALEAQAVSLTTLRTVTAALAGPEKAVVEAQAAWQAAEEARLAAEAAARAAAEQAAAAARASTRGKAGTTTRRGTSTRAPAAASGGAPAAATGGGAAPAAAGLPVAGSEASAGAIGAALNAHRAANGLGALSIVRSGARVEHAMQMAASNSIWHSGTRAGSPKARPEIVGRVSPGNATRMIVAYANSPSHNQQMLGSYSTAYIGAVNHGGWLYTSITFR